MIRKLTAHIQSPFDSELEVLSNDDPGPGGAHHEYRIIRHYERDVPGLHGFPHKVEGTTIVAALSFQNGPIKEVGINGITHEVLLAILIDRLQAFQAGPYACRENAIALTNLEQALMWLHERTRKRLARNVEGTHKI